MIGNRDHVSIFGLDTTTLVGFGYIFIPKDMDREVYIQDCFKRQQLNLLNETTRVDNVKIPKHLIGDIQFPLTYKELGSYILYVTIPKYNQPIAIGILNKDNSTNDIKEGEFKIIKSQSSTELAFVLNSRDGLIILKGDASINSELRLDFRGKESIINILCENKIYQESKDLESRVYNSHSIKIKGEKEDDLQTSIRYINGVGYEYKDEFGNEIICKEKQVEIKSEKIIHSTGTEPMVLGNKLVKTLNSLCDAISKLTVPTALGPSGVPINISDFQEIKKELEDIKSQISYLD